LTERSEGDTLSSREVVKNADLIFPGQKIRIPAMH
jgi:nucleoid-associated protein YgaU